MDCRHSSKDTGERRQQPDDKRHEAVRILDQHSAPGIEAAHTGKQHLSVVWCGRTQHFVTCGSDQRELKLWDPRQLAKCVHRERLDAGGVGQVFPMYDADLDLLYVLGKGDRSARMFEVDLTRAPASGSSVGGICEVVSYRVPRKEATHTFQSDLYPDTLSGEAAMTPEEWGQGRNAGPKAQPVKPTVKAVEDISGSVFGRSAVGTPASSET
ncbi:hypothetical protein DVH05_011369 [Phytophthora capsici]|nr:hypothetical protein DVH05_009713 [Phytophthora capsici]KAG1701132.1 hypothetical protein DVH05_011369 [Phytophthora capsici]